MKTAISLPDDLFRLGESAARKFRMSRSELYATALREFLERRRASSITARLDEIYSKQPSALDPALNSAQLQSLEKDSW